MSIADLASPPSAVGPASNGMLLSAAEYDAIDDRDRGYRYELVNGVLIVLPPPGFGERGPNDYLGHLLYSYQETHENGASLDDTAPEQELSCGANRRRMDRAIWAGLGRTPRHTEDVPAIAVEFVSESGRDRRRDYVEKRSEYVSSGVLEYWVIDRFEREMTVFRGDETIGIAEGESYQTPLLPGFVLPLAKLLERADRAGATDEQVAP